MPGRRSRDRRFHPIDGPGILTMARQGPRRLHEEPCTCVDRREAMRRASPDQPFQTCPAVPGNWEAGARDRTQAPFGMPAGKGWLGHTGPDAADVFWKCCSGASAAINFPVRGGYGRGHANDRCGKVSANAGIRTRVRGLGSIRPNRWTTFAAMPSKNFRYNWFFHPMALRKPRATSRTERFSDSQRRSSMEGCSRGSKFIIIIIKPAMLV